MYLQVLPAPPVSSHIVLSKGATNILMDRQCNWHYTIYTINATQQYDCWILHSLKFQKNLYMEFLAVIAKEWTKMLFSLRQIYAHTISYYHRIVSSYCCGQTAISTGIMQEGLI